MNREIKSRARHAVDGSWYYGCFNPVKEKNELCLGLFFQEIELGFLDIKTLGDYIGLKDKNGKEIYESDIVREVLDGVVTYEAPAFWAITQKGSHFTPNEDCEVIGNIYENEELLDDKG